MKTPRGGVNEARAVDMTGRVFGRLTVVGPSWVVPRVGRGRPVLRMPCRCSCGTTLDIDMGRLTKRKAKSCGGCGVVPRANTTHGHARSKPSHTYRIWHGMVQRCEAPNSSGYAAYGGRGVRVCDRWRHDFAAFLADMGERPAGKSIDRYPNGAGNYEPGNCRWATPKEQSRNTSSNRLVTFGGETLPLVVWCERIGARQQVITSRLNRGWPVDRALTEPIGKYIKRAA